MSKKKKVEFKFDAASFESAARKGWDLRREDIAEIMRQDAAFDEELLFNAFCEALLAGDFQKNVRASNGARNFIYVPFNQLESLRIKYDELIMAVASKFPDESRHETALRYIREREEHRGSEASKEL